HASTVTDAFNMGLISNDTPASIEEISKCDIIFLCAPVKQNVEYLAKIKENLNPNCILSDVGSVKGDIHENIEELGLTKNFIGGHPMAGSEKTGLANSSAYLLENAYYILTPCNDTAKDKVDAMYNFIKELDSIPIVLSPDEHDYDTAAISHLPHVVAAALVNLVQNKDNENETMKSIAAGGFKDITRISSSSPVMWQEICLTNDRKICELIDDYIDSLKSIREQISNKDPEAIIGFFENAKNYRDSFNITTKKNRSGVFEFYCDLIDEAGGIATIATILSTNGISLKNIGIVHNREFEQGVLLIELYDETSYNKSIELLKKHHYTIYER
ncbi:MAG: prephenate dehydrogenase/arogenate dehydrogenase family protein, partial [Acetatifactor sp.]|nr:prephenate dehydrogenase/arogenate dehydrogenase family protein [Acetatifactor sp.]